MTLLYLSQPKYVFGGPDFFIDDISGRKRFLN